MDEWVLCGGDKCERMDPMSEVKSLAAKMSLIMGEVPTMIKNGQNVQQKYAYVTAEDVKAALRPLLKKHKIGVFSQMLEVQRETAINKNQTFVVTVIAKMCFTLVCGETGERMDCLWYGESNDYADKAVNKAATAAEKYWLINTFMLSTSEPDADEETIETVAPAPAKRTPTAAPMTVDQFTAINTAGKQLYAKEWAGVARDLVRQFTSGRTGKASEMTEDEAGALYAQLQKEQVAA